MAAGYDPGLFVWATDRYALRAGPFHRDQIAADPDRYTHVDDTHPVVDGRGVLLDSKPVEPKAPDIPTPTPTDTVPRGGKPKE